MLSPVLSYCPHQASSLSSPSYSRARRVPDVGGSSPHNLGLVSGQAVNNPIKLSNTKLLKLEKLLIKEPSAGQYTVQGRYSSYPYVQEKHSFQHPRTG